MTPSDDELIRKNARTGLIVMAVVVGMITLAFASVPLYSLFCKVTGFGGTTMVAAELPDQIIDRTLTIKFNADTGRGMPWEFKPDIREVKVKLGERGIASFTARNTAKVPISGTAVYNVTPLKVGKYFEKIQCFCFDLQTLKPGEDIAMPVLFFVNPELHNDPDMDDVTTITLSYTFFQSDTEELEKALEDFYNQ